MGNVIDKSRPWCIGNCEVCGTYLFASERDAVRMTLPVSGQRCAGCRNLPSHRREYATLRRRGTS